MRQRGPSPRLAPRTLTVVFLGGVAGGLVRYGVTEAWQTEGYAFPWSTFVVNTTGAFLLPFLVVLLARLRPSSKLLRPLLGTGFLGALTTFSSVMTAVDQQLAHDRVGTGVAYLAASLVAAVLAAAAGLSAARMATRGRVVPA